jgi:hypothetical protein
MNDDVTLLRSVLPAYAGQDDARARVLSDQQVRAWTGESLVDLQGRVELDGLEERFDKLLMRCEFGDLRVIRALEHGIFDMPETVAAVEHYDSRIVAAAARAKTVGADELSALFDELERAFDARADVVVKTLKR